MEHQSDFEVSVTDPSANTPINDLPLSPEITGTPF